MIDALPAQLLTGLLGGVMIACAYLWSLWRSVQALAGDRQSLAGGPLAMLLRLVGVALALYVVMRYGGLPALLAATAGFTAVRILVAQRLGIAHDPGRSGS